MRSHDFVSVFEMQPKVLAVYEWDSPRTWSERFCGWLLPALIVFCLVLVVCGLAGCIHIDTVEIKVLDGVKTDVKFDPFRTGWVNEAVNSSNASSQPTSQPSDDDQIVPISRKD